MPSKLCVTKTMKPARTQLYKRICNILESAQTNLARSVNTMQVVTNWLIGMEIVEEQQSGKTRASYGNELLKDLSRQLQAQFGSGYGVDNLELFRAFYAGYPEFVPISDALRRKSSIHGTTQNSDALRRNSSRVEKPKRSLSLIQRLDLPEQDAKWRPGRLHQNLSWTHYRNLLRVEKPGARSFYEIETTQQNWSARELERQISSLLFERLARSRDKKGVLRLATKGQEIQKPLDLFKDPVVIEFLGLPESHRLVESKLEDALISNLQTFLLEMGKGFAFVSRQERITLDGDHFYIDLVFYHTVLKCYVLLDLKVGKLTHGDLGQLQLYVNYFDEERRTAGDQPTLGLILCTHKNDAVVRYTLGRDQSKKIFASRYQFHLPKEEELAAELRRELAALNPKTLPLKESKKKS